MQYLLSPRGRLSLALCILAMVTVWLGYLGEHYHVHHAPDGRMLMTSPAHSTVWLAGLGVAVLAAVFVAKLPPPPASTVVSRAGANSLSAVHHYLSKTLWILGGMALANAIGMLVFWRPDWPTALQAWFTVTTVLAAAILSGAGFLVRQAPRTRILPRWFIVSLLAVIPLAFLAMAFACSTALMFGCSEACSLILITVPPLVVLLAWRDRGTGQLLPLIAATLFIGFAPHCVCDNPANGPLIKAIGRSSFCYFAAISASVLALTATYGIHTRLIVTLMLSGLTVIIGFGIGHHYYHWPW